jgi:hypothetical protein
MRLIWPVLLFLPASILRSPSGQETPTKRARPLVETTVCEILKEPSAYNNRLVRLRGYVRASFEYSILLDAACPGNGIWFTFADGSVPPGLVAMVTGKGTPGGADSNGRVTPPIPVRLVKDSNFEELQHYLALSAKGERCAEEPISNSLPACTTYRVTATFTGRLDGVSKEVHAAHLKRTPQSNFDGKGFGHMGLFDAQIVVQSIENVLAEDESLIRESKQKQQ